MLNRVILMGRLTADPELKKTNSDLSVTSFSLAVDRNYGKGADRQNRLHQLCCMASALRNLSADIFPKAD